ncbi:hypothetical protein K8R78_08155 [bacterium]|nr:hypothetical protein [bacterium]
MSLVIALLGVGCSYYTAEGSVRELAAYNAVPEPVEHSPLPGELVGDPLDNPSAAVEANKLDFTLGGRVENYSINDGDATGSISEHGSLGARLSLSLGNGWSLAGGLRRLGSLAFEVGGREAYDDNHWKIDLGGDLWGAGASLSWGEELRLGIGVEGLYGELSYHVETPEDDKREEFAVLSGLRWRAALGWSSDDWALGAVLASKADLGRGPGLPWEGRVWFFLPLAEENGDYLQLQLLGGINGWEDNAQFTGTAGQDLSAMLNTAFLGRGGLRWLLRDGLQIEVGAEISTYPLLEGNDRLLYPSYALAVGFGSAWRWRGEAIYRHLGGQAGDLIDATTLELRLRLETSL